MVKGVEGIKAELRRHSLIDGNVLHERHVAVEEVRTKGCVAPDVSDLIKARASEPAGDRGCVTKIISSGQVCRTNDWRKQVDARTHSRCPLLLISYLFHISVRLTRCVTRY